MNLTRIPRKFLDDHQDRDLPTPLIWRADRWNYWIADDDQNIAELVNDAEFYAHQWGPDNSPRGLKSAAIALLEAIWLCPR